MRPEYDTAFPLEMRLYCNDAIPRNGIEYNFHYYPGQVHSFANRTDLTNREAIHALNRCTNATILWLNAYLH